MKLSKLIPAVALASTVSMFAQADKMEVPKDFNAWKDCGIGAMIFNNNGTAAAISNVIWDLGTTALSSQLSSQGMCQGNQTMAAVFVAERFAALEEEAAIGEGENLVAVLDIYGCSAAEQTAVIGAVRNDLASGIESASSDAQRAENLYNNIDNAAQSCAI